MGDLHQAFGQRNTAPAVLVASGRRTATADSMTTRLPPHSLTLAKQMAKLSVTWEGRGRPREGNIGKAARARPHSSRAWATLASWFEQQNKCIPKKGQVLRMAFHVSRDNGLRGLSCGCQKASLQVISPGET